MEDHSQLLTEKRLADSMNLDRMSVPEALRVMNAQDAHAIEAAAGQRENVARAIELVVRSFRSHGRLIYVGAGTSGRLGVLDAVECPPTFGVDATMVQGVLAGGYDAMFKSSEKAEDEEAAGAAAMVEKHVGAIDTVMGIAASGTTPFVRGALKRARLLGAHTIFLCCVERSDSEPPVNVNIRPLTGPEVLTGSTRLKAGTVTKIILNQITTLAMVQMGKAYENLMVDVKASNTKLRARAQRIVAMIAGVDPTAAGELLAQSNDEVKTAIVMSIKKLNAQDARAQLTKMHGFLRKAIHG